MDNGVPSKIVIMGNSRMSLHDRFSKLPPPTKKEFKKKPSNAIRRVREPVYEIIEVPSYNPPRTYRNNFYRPIGIIYSVATMFTLPSQTSRVLQFLYAQSFFFLLFRKRSALINFLLPPKLAFTPIKIVQSINQIIFNIIPQVNVNREKCSDESRVKFHKPKVVYTTHPRSVNNKSSPHFKKPNSRFRNQISKRPFNPKFQKFDPKYQKPKPAKKKTVEELDRELEEYMRKPKHTPITI